MDKIKKHIMLVLILSMLLFDSCKTVNNFKIEKAKEFVESEDKEEIKEAFYICGNDTITIDYKGSLNIQLYSVLKCLSEDGFIENEQKISDIISDSDHDFLGFIARKKEVDFSLRGTKVFQSIIDKGISCECFNNSTFDKLPKKTKTIHSVSLMLSMIDSIGGASAPDYLISELRKLTYQEYSELCEVYQSIERDVFGYNVIKKAWEEGKVVLKPHIAKKESNKSNIMDEFYICGTDTMKIQRLHAKQNVYAQYNNVIRCLVEKGSYGDEQANSEIAKIISTLKLEGLVILGIQYPMSHGRGATIFEAILDLGIDENPIYDMHSSTWSKTKTHIGVQFLINMISDIEGETNVYNYFGDQKEWTDRSISKKISIEEFYVLRDNYMFHTIRKAYEEGKIVLKPYRMKENSTTSKIEKEFYICGNDTMYVSDKKQLANKYFQYSNIISCLNKSGKYGDIQSNIDIAKILTRSGHEGLPIYFQNNIIYTLKGEEIFKAVLSLGINNDCIPTIDGDCGQNSKTYLCLVAMKSLIDNIDGMGIEEYLARRNEFNEEQISKGMLENPRILINNQQYSIIKKAYEEGKVVLKPYMNKE